MCHIAIEKALKAGYFKKLKKEPPKIHDLSKLSAISNLKPPVRIQDSIDKISAVSVTSRYPEDIKWALRSYTKTKTESVLKSTRKVVSWVKEELSRP